MPLQVYCLCQPCFNTHRAKIFTDRGDFCDRVGNRKFPPVSLWVISKHSKLYLVIRFLNPQQESSAGCSDYSNMTSMQSIPQEVRIPFPTSPMLQSPEAKHSRRLSYICNSYAAKNAKVVTSLLTSSFNLSQQDDIRMRSHGLRHLVTTSLLQVVNRRVAS